jgi:hypothetical protein
MTRRELLYGLGQLPLLAQSDRTHPKMLGIYVHMHWPYRYPYAARTWKIEDWRGYAQGVRALGFNTVMFWPVIEVMPDPPTPGDRASLEKHGKVVRMLHEEFGMRVLISLCPNVAAISEEAKKATFENRHFFYCDRRVNPADPKAVRQMLETERKLLEPMREADGFMVIDSDPGGYAGSTNAEFVELLGHYREMLNRLRPGTELIYWMHAGWAAYSRYYQTTEFKAGTPAEYADTLGRLAKLNPEPWGIATARAVYADKAGLSARVIALNYGRIESEPSFPLTNFGGDKAWEGGHSDAARGVIGNAQTHCVQLPNTFAFARGAQGKPVDRSAYVEFAHRLIPGHEEVIVRAWEAVGGEDSGAMRAAAKELAPALKAELNTGDLKGLLFGSPRRFINDLLLMLPYKAAGLDLIAALGAHRDVRRKLGEFVVTAEAWQKQHGYENRWKWAELQQACAELHSKEVDEAWEPTIEATGFEKVRRRYHITETMTPRILNALRNTWSGMKS